MIETYSQRQWAAVNSHRSFNIDAPQKWPPRRVKLAINGIEPRSASTPPTMRPFRAVISWKFDSNPLHDIDESVRSVKNTKTHSFFFVRLEWFYFSGVFQTPHSITLLDAADLFSIGAAAKERVNTYSHAEHTPINKWSIGATEQLCSLVINSCSTFLSLAVFSPLGLRGSNERKSFSTRIIFIHAQTQTIQRIIRS